MEKFEKRKNEKKKLFEKCFENNPKKLNILITGNCTNCPDVEITFNSIKNINIYEEWFFSKNVL